MIDFVDQPKNTQPQFGDISEHMAINVSSGVTVDMWLTADGCGN
jgi:hypothetical protein